MLRVRGPSYTNHVKREAEPMDQCFDFHTIVSTTLSQCFNFYDCTSCNNSQIPIWNRLSYRLLIAYSSFESQFGGHLKLQLICCWLLSTSECGRNSFIPWLIMTETTTRKLLLTNLLISQTWERFFTSGMHWLNSLKVPCCIVTE